MDKCDICNFESPSLTKEYKDGEKVNVCCFCHERHSYHCRSCDKHFIVTQQTSNLHRDHFKCNKCLMGACFEDSEEGILDYSFKPIPYFRGGEPSSDVLTMGIELEMADSDSYDKVSEFAQRILNYEKRGYSFFYGKSDGSLEDASVEVVSHPATLEFHLSTTMWEKMLNEAISAGLRSSETDCCGIHIHVNRNYFTADQINKLDALVNRLNITFRRFARRNCEDYARYNPNKSRNALGSNSYGRYSCLNINQNTIEFRIFKGNLKYKSVMALFELVQGTCDFVKLQDINLDLFFGDKYILKKTFKEYLENRNFVYLPNYTTMCRVWRDLEPQQNG